MKPPRTAPMRRLPSPSTSLYARLLASFLFVALSLALVIGGAAAWSSYRIGLGRSFDQLSSVARLKAAEIDLWTHRLMLALSLTLNDNELVKIVVPFLQGRLPPTEAASGLRLLSEDFKDTIAKSGDFTQLCLLDTRGRVIASTDPSFLGADEGGEEYYRQGLQMDFISRPIHAVATGRLTVVAAHPLVVPGKGAVGILAGWSDLSFLEGIMAEPAGLGQTGESFLAGTDFLPLTSLRAPPVRNPGLSRLDEGARRAMENRVNGQGIYLDYRSVRVLGVYTWMPTLGLAMVVEQDLAEALKPVTSVLGIGLGVTLTAVLLAIALAAGVARGIAAPLRALSETAALVAAGDLERTVELGRRDEIGQLALAFGDMTGRLRTLITELREELAERRAAEERLRASESRNRTILQTAMDGFLRLDREGRILEVNRAYCQMSGFSEEEILSRGVADLEALESPEEVRAHIAAIMERGSVRFESRHRRKDGSSYDTESSVTYQAAAGGILVSFLRDITDRKRAESEVRRSLAEKETLLRELHHRTKNNMGVIIAMLDLQAAQLGDEKLTQAFTDLQNRIRSMALVHQKLYEAHDLSRIDLGSYLRDLAELLGQSIAEDPGRITVETSVAEVPVLIDTAIPCGLILNELFSNACKHAFPEGRRGHIRIGARLREGELIELSFSDEGVGFPPGFDPRRDGSMGLQTIRSLAEQQLRGELRLESAGGVSFSLLFRDDRYRARV